MPLIDVSDLLTDPDFCETVTLTRSVETVSGLGRASEATTTTNITAVVTAINGDFIRQTDAEFAVNQIMVHSQTRLRGITPGAPADIVGWKGNTYVVKRSNDWSNYGVGFSAATCELQEVTAEV